MAAVVRTRALRLSLPLLAACAVVLAVPAANAATSPSLGMASTFSILASTYTNTVSGTTINGDLGYTTGPAVAYRFWHDPRR